MAKKLKSSLVNMILSLTIVSVVAAGLLALVNHITAEVIAEGDVAAKQEGILAVTPEFDNSPFEEEIVIEVEGKPVKLYPARRSGELVGVAIEVTSSRGYGGDVTILVGIHPTEYTIFGYTVLAHSETPGLGDQMQEWFRVEGTSHNVIGMGVADPLLVTKDGGTIDAISAATISSRAFLECINMASTALQSAQGEGLL